VRGLDPAILQSCLWEVLEVEGHQRLGMPSDRSGQDVPIVLVGQVEASNEVLVADHGCVFEGCVHELDPPSDPLRREVGSDAKDRLVRLLEDLRRPERAEQSGLGEAKQGVRERARNEHARIEQGGIHRLQASLRRASASAAY
jgi:hypothetical protein